FEAVAFSGRNDGAIAHRFFPAGFAGMVTPDRTRFDLRHYAFRFQGREFLGSVRCVMFDVNPLQGTARGSFVGRIWAEDEGFHLVRFDGTYIPNSKHRYVHFDSWRLNLGPDLWLPAAIYSQESDQRIGLFGHVNFKAQTRFWGYQLSAPASGSSLTEVQVETPGAAQDDSAGAQERTPLGAQRAWQLKAENDVLQRMQQAGLLAPAGAVDAVLQTVVTNLEVTNKLALEPEVRCRVMLTAPLESFTVGHTIVLSRGLIDVLPDEASLAMVLAHELGHIALNHPINSDYAFDDRMMFPDQESFERILMARTPGEEAAADERGIELLKQSPYKAQLAEAALFLEALQRAAPGLPNLIRAHWGNSLVVAGRLQRMHALLERAPQLQVRNLKQIPALPLGARLHLDPWSDHLSLLQAPAEALLSASDKLQFEITPMLPYLSRQTAAPAAASIRP
ncbi:MAG: M48 family metalloprotease, partial [Terriglobales bacterium]